MSRKRLEDYVVKGGLICPFCGAKDLAAETVYGKRGGTFGAMAMPTAGRIRCTQCGAHGPKAAYQTAGNGTLLHKETIEAAVALWNVRVQVTVTAPPPPQPLRPGDITRDAMEWWQQIMWFAQTGRGRPRLTRLASAALARMGGYEVACTWKPEETPEKYNEFHAYYLDAYVGGQDRPKKTDAGQDE